MVNLQVLQKHIFESTIIIQHRFDNVFTCIYLLHRLPIEAIKAGLYSKESDVYAFGMITWEVMSAFGQEGVVYDQDEERELTCIPFNYQQSENVRGKYYTDKTLAYTDRSDKYWHKLAVKNEELTNVNQH